MRISLLTFCLCVVLIDLAPAADSLHFRQVGQWGTNQLTAVAVKGTYAYVGGVSDDLYAGLHVLSLADLAHPVEVWRCTTMGGSWDVAVSGEYLYYANDTAGLRVFSISDPANPVEVARWRERRAIVVKVSGDYAYVRDTGLSVISVADPTHPQEVGYIKGPGGLQPSWAYVDVVGDYAYATAWEGGMHIISVADPTHPVEVGHHTSGDVRGVAVRDSYAYIGCVGSFQVVSVADPSSPVEVGSLDSTGFTGWGMVSIRGYALAAAGENSGLWAISVSDPTHPTLVGYYGGRFGWYSLVTDGDYVYYAGFGLRIYQFYQLGDLDIDNDSLDVSADTLRLRRWTNAPGDSLECVRGEFILANTNTSYNPDPTDGPSVSSLDSLRCTGSLTGPGGTIDSIVIPNLPESLAQWQTLLCTLAAYLPVGLRVGDYSGSILISGKDTANLQAYESCYVCLRKLGDIDVDNDSLDVVADTVRLPPTDSAGLVLGEFVLANTSVSYNPDTADGPSLSSVDSLSFTGSLSGPGGTLDSVFIQGFPAALAQGHAVGCTLAVHVPDSLPVGDYAGSIVINGLDSVSYPAAETVHVLLRKIVGVIGDLDIDKDSLDVAHDTVNLRTQPAGPVYHPYAKAEFMLANTSSAYNPDVTDGPSRSTLRQVEVEVKGQDGTRDSVYVLNQPESLAVGQAVACTLAVVLPDSTAPEGHSGWVTVSAYDTSGHQVRDSFFLKVHGPEPRQNLDSLRAAPIPFKPNQNPEHDAIHFQGLSAGARVIVYDASGQSVWIASENGDGHLKWDAKVASGIYVYLVVSADGKSSKVGKLSVIR